MSTPPTGPSKAIMAFDAWRLLLRKDCELQDKLLAFDAMGDYVLHLLWKFGVDPTVDGILKKSSEQTNPSEG